MKQKRIIPLIAMCGNDYAIGKILAPFPLSDTLFHMQAATNQLRSFLQYYTVQLIEHPEQAQLRVAEIDPGKLRFRLILNASDVALLIGKNGFTASAIRSVMKAAADRHNIQFSLQIHSHEEEAARAVREEQ